MFKVENISLYLYIVLIFWSLPTKKFDYVFILEPIEISFPKTNISLAALKDSQLSVNYEADLWDAGLEVTMLELNNSTSLEMIIAKNESPKVIEISNGITLNKDEIIFFSKNHKRREALASYASILNPQQMNRLLMVDDIDSILFEDWSAKRLEDYAETLISQKKAEIKSEGVENSNEVSNEKVASGASLNFLALDIEKRSRPTYIFARNSSDQNYGQSQNSINVNKPTSAIRYAHNNRMPEKKTNNNADVGASSIEQPRDNDWLSSSMAPSLANSTHILKGSFEFSDGMAYIFGEHDLKIFHRFNDTVLSEAFILWNQANFEMPVDFLFGELVAEVIDRDGFVVGYGELSLNGINLESYEIKGFYLPIRPNYNGLNIRTISGYSSGTNIKEEANVAFNYVNQPMVYSSDRTGKYSSKQKRNGSTGVYQFKGKGQTKTIKYIQTAKKENVFMFSDSMVRALRTTLREQGYIGHLGDGNGMIWGRIQISQRGSSGAEVRLSDKEAFGPVYLNQIYLPDSKLTKTANHGYFVVAGLKAGLHSIEFNYDGQRFTKTIEVHRDSITQLDASFEEKIEQRLSIQSIDYDEIQEIEAFVIGSSDAKIIRTNPFILESRAASASNLFEFRRAGGFFTYRVNIPQTERSINLKILNEEKLDHLRQAHGWYNAALGFVEPENFSGLLLDYEPINENKILYFDSYGEIIPQIDLERRWSQISGFILPNVVFGPHQIQVLEASGQYKSNYIIMAEDIIHLLP